MLDAASGRQWVSPIQRNARAAVRGETLTDFGKRWIAGRLIKESTRLLYADLFKKHLEPALGGVAISGLTVADVNRWHATLLPDNPTRRSHAYRLLSAICNSAVEGDLLVKNPCQIKRAGSVKRKREPILLTIAELAAVADAIKPERFRAMVLLSAWCALRFGK